jgi:hypothetical protein
MSVTTPPPPIIIRQRRSGFGCVGCGCTVLAILALLFLVLVGSGLYVAYKTVLGVSSTTAADVPGYEGGEQVFTSAEQKIAAFSADVDSHKPSTLQLNGDEINAIIAHDPAVIERNIHVHVTLTDTVQVQAAVPSAPASWGIVRDRYFNIDTTCAIAFDANSKRLELMPTEVQIGDKVLVGGDAARDQSATAGIASVITSLNQLLNDQMQKDPHTADLLHHAQTIAVTNGQLVIQTQ